jgi:hypothetical protein
MSSDIFSRTSASVQYRGQTPLAVKCWRHSKWVRESSGRPERATLKEPMRAPGDFPQVLPHRPPFPSGFFRHH